MLAQRELNVKLVTQHEKLRKNTNDHLGGTAPFMYTTSPWGSRSSREGSPESDGEYVTAPVHQSSSSPKPIPIPPPTNALKERSPSPSRPISPPISQERQSRRSGPLHPYGGTRSLQKAKDRRRCRAAEIRAERGLGKDQVRRSGVHKVACETENVLVFNSVESWGSNSSSGAGEGSRGNFPTLFLF